MPNRTGSALLVGVVLTLVGACKTEGGFGTFTCAEVKESACVAPTDKFVATAPVVHFVFKTKDLPKNGDVYSVKWIAEDVGAAAPANTVIDTVKLTVSDMVDAATSYTVTSQLSKPNNDWPKGAYRIEVTLGEKPATTARFKIE